MTGLTGNLWIKNGLIYFKKDWELGCHFGSNGSLVVVVHNLWRKELKNKQIN